MKPLTKSRNADVGGVLTPSPFVRRFAARVSEAAAGLPVLDVASGSGRNAFRLAELGSLVVCIDNDLDRMQVPGHIRGPGRVEFMKLDLKLEPWPFGPESVGGIINVHFYLAELLPHFVTALRPGSYLLLESFPGCGGNYLQLPPAGLVRSVLSERLDLHYYKERRVGPKGSDAVTVHLLAQKRSASE
jgi:SAM-dependent methyltransferase